MKDQEGNVMIERITRININGKPLNKCNEQEITKEILSLCSRVDELRQQCAGLKDELKTAEAELEELAAVEEEA